MSQVTQVDSEQRMRRTVRQRRGPRYQSPLATLQRLSAGLREFRSQLLGKTRVRLRGRDAMLAGRQRTPHQLAIEYLDACHRAGLSRATGDRFAEWVAIQVSLLWADDPMPLTELAAAEQRAENHCNTAQLRHLQQPTPETQAALTEALLAEAAAERAFVAGVLR